MGRQVGRQVTVGEGMGIRPMKCKGGCTPDPRHLQPLTRRPWALYGARQPFGSVARDAVLDPFVGRLRGPRAPACVCGAGEGGTSEHAGRAVRGDGGWGDEAAKKGKGRGGCRMARPV